MFRGSGPTRLATRGAVDFRLFFDDYAQHDAPLKTDCTDDPRSRLSASPNASARSCAASHARGIRREEFLVQAGIALATYKTHVRAILSNAGRRSLDELVTSFVKRPGAR
jgi:hypothetical protein